MEFLFDYIFWFLLLATIAFIYLYKWISRNPDALTSKYKTTKSFQSAICNLQNPVRIALENAGFKKSRIVEIRGSEAFHFIVKRPTYASSNDRN